MATKRQQSLRRFARNFTAARGDRSLDSIAKALGCSYAAVASWSQGRRIPDEYLEALAKELWVSQDELMRGVG